ncbi:ABC transporter ATP-binding protein [Treponema pedis]|uniref:ABC transporter ATP-binding protein n=1 Tax=Treponema pedis TaxID=409322 RepID=A0A7S7AWH9_9SPIR|nr:ABC transporter ATP-binding protein [Treponema pedis]QOW60937.1 ABC transporter ATP-binding protein [Treponema pedis]QSI04205.1 ABC transporter ATP-binding protein [Treponema pedis]
MDNHVIEVTNLSRTFKTHTGFLKKKTEVVNAVQNVSFKVNQGEIFGLVGPNGAGKTTIIKILTTILAPTGGTCKVLGYDTFGQEKQIRPHINFIFGGEYGVYRRLSAKDNLTYFSNLYKIPAHIQNERIPKLLNLVGLAERANYRVETYSKGMIQRLQIAKGLINNPQIIFMDEPTIGLDPIGATELHTIIKRLTAQSKTIVFTSHYMHEVQELCQRVAIINKGNLLICDTVDNLMEQIDNIISMTVEIRNKIDTKKILEIEGVIETEWLNKDCSKLRIKYTTGYNNIAACIIEALESNNIIKMDISEPSLENVYIKLVGINHE